MCCNFKYFRRTYPRTFFENFRLFGERSNFQKDILTNIMNDVCNAAACYDFDFESSDSEEIEAIISEKNV